MIDQAVQLSDRQALARALTGTLEAESHWRSLVDSSLSSGPGPTAHLAILREPYLEHVLAGRKTVESRFARKLIPPHGVVRPGDLLLLKHASGPLVGLALVGFVRSYVLEPAAWREIRERFSRAMCADDAEFWEERRDARFATLMQISDKLPIRPITVDKQDRRGWVVLRDEAAVHGGQLELLERAGGEPSGRTAVIAPPSPPQPDPLPALVGQPQLSLPGAAFA